MDSTQISSLKEIWDNYKKSNMKVLDTKGNEYLDINSSRLEAIQYLKKIIIQFQSDKINIYEFKTTIDSYNKRNNLWGFTATKGQMFFNQLVTNSESRIAELTELLKKCISCPEDINSALGKIQSLETYCNNIYKVATDKRKVPNPKSVGYFLSYFWQIHNYKKWPILYTSLILSYSELNLWHEKSGQKETYQSFFNINEEIKAIFKQHSNQEITNWDAEHAFWNFRGNPNKPQTTKKEEEPAKKVEKVEKNEKEEVTINASFELSQYLVPKVVPLIELGFQTDISPTRKGSDYEKLVSEIFKLLDFEVETLGQGKGRNPDAIIKYREDHVAFLVDAKAYGNGYSLGLDDRAIKEYINYYCPKLRNDGFRKIGFIIVCNSFKSNLDDFVNEITWDTEIKRFILLQSEALLYLLAYKTKDRLSTSRLIESLVRFSNPITAQDIISEFDDI